jgi:7,8-dihydropterin-6-yl-methyl-4-(beta-D-ribofuranosyl)aminobenzene 5'-phosphate synthase
MKLINLVDNTSTHSTLGSEHGLSTYIETKHHHLLFDLGHTDLFARNAHVLNIDLSSVDLVILSHGHYDHGGGLKTFFALNQKAKVYIHHAAFKPHYSIKGDLLKNIGIDPLYKDHPQVILVDTYPYHIDDDLVLYGDIHQNSFVPSGNKVLLEEDHPDAFHHEQNLIIHEGKQCVLMAGCAHNGIVNIVEQIQAQLKTPITHVFGGFHLYNLTMDTIEDPEIIHQIALRLKASGAQYHTGHCTGQRPYALLKEDMQESVTYFEVGHQISI